MPAEIIYVILYGTVIEGGIGQAVPEHPKREFILALSTAFGDAYLFQVYFCKLLDLTLLDTFSSKHFSVLIVNQIIIGTSFA